MGKGHSRNHTHVETDNGNILIKDKRLNIFIQENSTMSSSSTENLHVPQSKSGSALNSQSVKSIMDAYKTQSKIQLYDDNSAQSQGAGNENIGVTGRNKPLSMLRPSANPVQDIDENGNIVVSQRRPSRGRMLQEAEAYGNIAKAYQAMKGIDDDNEEQEQGNYDETVEDYNIAAPRPRNKDLSSVRRFEAEYMEDMPDTDEGLLEVLALAINNARANLEMLESLYAALSPAEENYQEA